MMALSSLDQVVEYKKKLDDNEAYTRHILARNWYCTVNGRNVDTWSYTLTEVIRQELLKYLATERTQLVAWLNNLNVDATS